MAWSKAALRLFLLPFLHPPVLPERHRSIFLFSGGSPQSIVFFPPWRRSMSRQGSISRAALSSGHY
jgi:hypothetical protein